MDYGSAQVITAILNKGKRIRDRKKKSQNR